MKRTKFAAILFPLAALCTHVPASALAQLPPPHDKLLRAILNDPPDAGVVTQLYAADAHNAAVHTGYGLFDSALDWYTRYALSRFS